MLSGPAVERLKNCGAREVVLTDTVPIPRESAGMKLFDRPVDRPWLLAKRHPRRIRGRPVAELFDTYPEHHGQRLPVPLITCVVCSSGKHTMRDATWRSLSVKYRQYGINEHLWAESPTLMVVVAYTGLFFGAL